MYNLLCWISIKQPYSISKYDAHTGATFCMCAILLWIMSSFPTCALLSSWTMKWVMGCRYCKDKISSRSLHTYGSTGHTRRRCLLPVDHRLRDMNGPFDDREQNREAPGPPSNLEVYDQVRGMEAT